MSGTQQIDKEAGGLGVVAKRAQVSTGTVSRVFNNSPLIPADTRARVLAAARDLGFRPRVGMRKKQIALVTEPPHKTLMGGYVNTMTQYICFALSRADAVISMITEDRIRHLDDGWFDGIIGIAWEEETVTQLKTFRNVPVVWLSDNYCDSFHTIYLDPQETGRLAGEYLRQKGHRRIAVIHETDYSGCGRVAGAKAACEQSAHPGDLFLPIPNTISLHLAVRQILDAGCTAIWVTGEDLKVLEVNWLLQDLAGKKVPEEISLLGFENPGISEFLRPALTAISSPLQQIAEKAVEIVLQEPQALQKIELKPRLIERSSVRSL